MSVDTLLEIDALVTSFRTPRGTVRAVDGVSLSVARGQTVCIAGESGCGKSVTALSVMGLLPDSARIESGAVRFNGVDVLALAPAERRGLRGRALAMIFQEPMTALNPVYTVGEQISEGLRLHEGLSRAAAMERAAELLALVHISQPARRVHDYPHQFSGGMRQRVMIAMALACNPRLLIADEPTTALDVTIQAQILDLLSELKERLGMAVLLITHAMGVVAEVAQRVVVMYAGQVIEEGSVEEVFERPWHPYTQGLIRSIPRIDADASRGSRLVSIPGTVPSLIEPPPGCRFAPRCAYARDACTQATPALRQVGPGHRVACILEEAPL